MGMPEVGLGSALGTATRRNVAGTEEPEAVGAGVRGREVGPVVEDGATPQPASAGRSTGVTSQPVPPPLPVGRRTEVQAFLNWLAADPPPSRLLVLQGRPGSGKTTLLAAFDLAARQAGWAVLSEESAPLATPPASASIALLDWSAGLPPTWRTILGRLLAGTGRAVVACRRWPAADGPAGEASPVVLPVGPLAPEDAAEYLRSRGVPPGPATEQALAATRGHPAALAAAASLLGRFPQAELESCPDWRLAVHRWAEELWHEAGPGPGRQALEVAAMVHEVDESLLRDLLGEAGPAGFGALVATGWCRPADVGLVLAPDVRAVLAPDLRWRDPQRWYGLRTRAAEHYRRRSQESPLAEQRRLVAEQLFLLHEPLVHELVFGDEEPGRVGVVPWNGDQRAAILDLWSKWVGQTFGIARVSEAERSELSQILDFPGSRVQLARDRLTGQLLGFSAVVPVCRGSLALLRQCTVTASLWSSCWSRPELAALAATSDSSRAFFLHHLAAEGPLAGGAQAALLRDALGYLALGGVYFVSAALPPMQRLAEVLGFRRVPQARNGRYDPRHPVEGYVLDLSRRGLPGLLEDLLAGRASSAPLDAVGLEETLQDTLAHWGDPDWLARCPLRAYLGLADGLPPGPAAAALRQAVRRALARLMAQAPPPRRIAYRALQMAYLEPDRSHEAVAHELGVSRSTFYRLLRRAIRDLSAELSWRGPVPTASGRP
jgi:hypothetical protein